MSTQVSQEFIRATKAEVGRLMEAATLPVSPGASAKFVNQLKAVKRQARTWSIGDVVDEVEKLAGQMMRDKRYRQNAGNIRRKTQALRSRPSPRSAVQVIDDLLLIAQRRGEARVLEANERLRWKSKRGFNRTPDFEASVTGEWVEKQSPDGPTLAGFIVKLKGSTELSGYKIEARFNNGAGRQFRGGDTVNGAKRRAQKIFDANFITKA